MLIFGTRSTYFVWSLRLSISLLWSGRGPWNPGFLLVPPLKGSKEKRSIEGLTHDFVGRWDFVVVCVCFSFGVVFGWGWKKDGKIQRGSFCLLKICHWFSVINWIFLSFEDILLTRWCRFVVSFYKPGCGGDDRFRFISQIWGGRGSTVLHGVGERSHRSLFQLMVRLWK